MYSATSSESHPILRIMFYCLASAFRSWCPQLYHTHPKATYFFAHQNSSILDLHCHPNGQNVRPIGLWIHRVLNGLVGRMQLVSGFPVSEFWSMRGVLMGFQCL
ncbi:hypothetical protein B0H14DRAFT_3158446 [Mycena olivaceomarginata]|nr:hypothetical protein B0H14DRAFT_3158446 [Mycena olivaceomarginata]